MMPKTVAAFADASAFDDRLAPRDIVRRLVRPAIGTVAFAVGVVATACALILAATFSASWVFNVAVANNPHIHPQPIGPRLIALTDRLPALPAPNAAAASTAVSTDAKEQRASFDTKWNLASVQPTARAAPAHAVKPIRTMPLPPAKPGMQEARGVPLPHPRPVMREIAASKPTPQLAAIPPRPYIAAQFADGRKSENKLAMLPGIDDHTAVYDISARTVYMPNGDRLEAHSGLGGMMDDPRYVKVKNRGPTPPNVYDLTLREDLFHGVRAIRLNPVDESKMFNRDGMLAHTYMLGSNGQSNGCVSFRNYDRFLQAYLRGEVARLVVVPHLGDAPPRIARAGELRRYASADDVSLSTDQMGR